MPQVGMLDVGIVLLSIVGIILEYRRMRANK